VLKGTLTMMISHPHKDFITWKILGKKNPTHLKTYPKPISIPFNLEQNNIIEVLVLNCGIQFEKR
jgi:hypothetical protein